MDFHNANIRKSDDRCVGRVSTANCSLRYVRLAEATKEVNEITFSSLLRLSDCDHGPVWLFLA